jgi:hypothetical protein
LVRKCRITNAISNNAPITMSQVKKRFIQFAG